MERSPARSPLLALALLVWLPVPGGDGFDWERDRVVLRNGEQLHGVVIQSFAPDHVLLLREGNRREEIPRAEIESVVLLRDHLAGYMRIRSVGYSLKKEWSLAQDAERVGLTRMARLQAYYVLLADPEHAGAHELLGHERRKDGWLWTLDGELVSQERFLERNGDWNDRFVLDSEHFTVETDCELRRGLDVLFDLEALYLWWMEHLGPSLLAAEDVDDPGVERMTFLVHRGPDDPSFLKLTSDRDPYYDPSGDSTAATGNFNVARTYFVADEARPRALFELATEMLLYSTLVLGRTLDEADFKLRRLCHWAEVGLGYWIAQHYEGTPAYPEFAAPFIGSFELDPDTASASLAKLGEPHLLRKGPSELENLVELPFFELVGHARDERRSRARCASFVSFLLEVNQPLRAEEPGAAGSRDAFWRYLREVYGTQRATRSDAFDAGLEGGSVAMFEEPWKSWTAGFAR